MSMTQLPLKYQEIPENSAIRRIKYATFQGGGMKGIGDVGALEKLEELGVTSQLEEVAGSSVGGIIALLVALGYTAKEIRMVMMAFNFKAIQDKEAPGWIESSGIKDMLQGGLEGLDMADKFKILRRLPKVRKALSMPKKMMEGAEIVEDLFNFAYGTDMGLWKGETLSSIVSSLIARKTGKPNITFAELEALTKIHPGRFKSLHLTGSNLTTKTLEIYNAKNTPNQTLLDSIRITTSLPVGFMPVTKPLNPQEEEDLKRGIVPVRVDGGLLQNLPDVFNHPPYYQPTEDKPGNPEVLAVAFLSPHYKKPHQFKNGIDLIRGLYSTLISESELHAKYGDRIVYIDTKGVGTVDFSAPQNKRLALANSGREAIESQFRKILTSEKTVPLNFEKMSTKELIRQKVAMQYRLSEVRLERSVSVQQTLLSHLRKINFLLEKRQVSEQVQNDLVTIEKSRLKRRLSGLASYVPSDEELVSACKQRRNELVRIVRELEEKYRQLKLVKQGFQWRLTELQARYARRGFKNSFVKQLDELDYYQKLIRKNRDQKVNLELNLNDGNIDKIQFIKMKKDIDGEHRWLMHAKDLYFRGILTKCRDDRDELMCHFFEELEEESQDINFQIPNSSEKVLRFYSKEIKTCKEYMEGCRNEARAFWSEKNKINEYIHNFSKRTKVAPQYEVLKNLKVELDRSIYEKTSFIAKINNYLTSGSGTRVRNVVTALMQGVAFFAFLIRIASMLPVIGIAYLVRRASPSDSKRRAIADRAIHAISMPNLFKLNKLKAFTETTAHIIKVLEDNYATSDVAEHSYLYKLLAYHLKNTGIKVKEVFPKKEEETDEVYETRIKTLEKNLELVAPDSMVLLDERNPGNRNVEDLRRKVFTEVLHMKDPALERKYGAEDSKRRADRARLITKQNVSEVHQNFIHFLDKKLKEGLQLTRYEVVEYVDSAHYLKQKVPDPIKLEYLFFMNLKLESGRALKEKYLKTYIEFSQALGKNIPLLVREHYAKLLQRKETSFKRGEDRMLKHSMDDFIQRRRKDKAAEGENQPESQPYLKPRSKPRPDTPPDS